MCPTHALESVMRQVANPFRSVIANGNNASLTWVELIYNRHSTMTSPNGSFSPIRKAFLPGAGLGTRLRPLTDKLPKPLIPFYHEPLVIQTLRKCREAGITDVMINTHHLPECWEQSFPDSEWEGIKLNFSYEPTLLDTGGGLKNVEDWINNDPVLVCNADNLTDFPLMELMRGHQDSGSLATLVLRSSGYNRNVAFDPASGLITDMRCRLGVHPGSHQFTGIYCLRPEILEYIPSGTVISIVETFLKLIPDEVIRGLEYNDGYWMDLGTPDIYIDAHRLVKGQKISAEASIAPDAFIDTLSIIGPGSIIGAGTTLRECIVWPGAMVPGGTIAHRKIFMQ